MSQCSLPAVLQPGPAVGGPPAQTVTPTVWIIDDDSECRERLMAAAGQCGAVARDYAEPRRFLREFAPELPGCVLVDAHLPDMSGLRLIQQLAGCFIPAPVIALLGRADTALVVALMKAGAFDVLEKPFTADVLAQRLAQALEHDGAQRRMGGDHQEIRQRLTELTQRERQVLELVTKGLTSRAIAAALSVCERTVEIYRSRIKHKMGSRNAADLVRQMHLLGEARREEDAPWRRPLQQA